MQSLDHAPNTEYYTYIYYDCLSKLWNWIGLIIVTRYRTYYTDKLEFTTYTPIITPGQQTATITTDATRMILGVVDTVLEGVASSIIITMKTSRWHGMEYNYSVMHTYIKIFNKLGKCHFKTELWNGISHCTRLHAQLIHDIVQVQLKSTQFFCRSMTYASESTNLSYTRLLQCFTTHSHDSLKLQLMCTQSTSWQGFRCIIIASGFCILLSQL